VTWPGPLRTDGAVLRRACVSLVLPDASSSGYFLLTTIVGIGLR